MPLFYEDIEKKESKMPSTTLSTTETTISNEKSDILPLIYRVNEVPKWNTALLIGFQV